MQGVMAMAPEWYAVPSISSRTCPLKGADGRRTRLSRSLHVRHPALHANRCQQWGSRFHGSKASAAGSLCILDIAAELASESRLQRVVWEAPQCGIPLTIVEAVSEEELKAAAYLRARTFYTYPQDRSPDAIKAHRQMKAQDDWRALVTKVNGFDDSYGRVVCLIAMCPQSSLDLDNESDLLTSCKVGPNSIVVGSLDLNQGIRLPGEITGDYPVGPDAATQRGYLSNVCVAEEVRRKGVAIGLIESARKTAGQWGITDLYVHVVFDNVSAQNLYAKAGFKYEKEENSLATRWEARPRRLLLHSDLQIVGDEADTGPEGVLGSVPC